MFNYFKKRNIYKLPNTKSIAFGFQGVRKVNQYLAQEDFNAISNFYTNLNSDEKSLLLDGVALDKDNIDSIFRWHNQYPQDWLANLFAGVSYTFVAWAQRTGQDAKYVTSHQFQGFHENLEQANICLSNASLSMPNEEEIYSRLIRVHMGLSEKEKAQNCFDTLYSINPNHLGGHLFMVNLLAPKWLGSFKEMKAFASQYENPQKNDLRFVVFMHFAVQHFVDLSDENERTAEKIFKKTYRSTIKKGYQQFDMANIPSLHRYYLHNYFSYIFYLLDENRLRNKEIDLIGNHISFFPWAYAEVSGEQDLKLMKFS